jgi:hypothetical protein
MPGGDKFDPQEAPTRPDGFVECPSCRGEDGLPRGYVLKTTETGSTYRTEPETCPTCRGEKLVDRAVAARLRARAE